MRSSIETVSEQLNFALRFKKLANAIHSSPNFNGIMVGLREQILNLYSVQMATIYLADRQRREIFSWVVLPGDGIKKIRIPISSRSIAGYVAQTGRVVSIRNVYDSMELMNIDPDLSFDCSWDRKTGSKTQQVLAVPILYKGKLLGVIQIINKEAGEDFSGLDQKNLYDLSDTLGIAFHNHLKFTQSTRSKYHLLIKSGILSKKELARAQAYSRHSGFDMEQVLIHNCKVPKLEIAGALSQYYDLPYEDISGRPYLAQELLKGVNIEYFRKAYFIPYSRKDGKIRVAINDPHDQNTLQEVMRVVRTGEFELRFALKEDIEKFIELHTGTAEIVESKKTDKTYKDILKEMSDGDEVPVSAQSDQTAHDEAEDSAIVQLVRKIVEDAHENKASDIHIEPYGNGREAEVRFRIDGRCVKTLEIPGHHIRAVVSRFKILAHLDISERRKPQDGKIRFKTGKGKVVELRVATIPTAEGNEDVVLRILADSEPLPLKQIMPERVFTGFSKVVNRPYGLILVVGPTGSGKTTTLHSAMAMINTPEKKIWTAEDPVEITQYRLRQVQVNPKIGLTFAAAMRSFLRADPDVIMVGEMRDQETARTGIEASLTGHLVLSTLHTNSAPETVTRLIDMEIDPFSFADALLGIIAQRLVRTLCDKCRVSYHPDRTEYDHLRALFGDAFDALVGKPYTDGLLLYRAGGCEACQNEGYKGRMGLYELLTVSDRLKRKIIEGGRVEEIKAIALEEGMTTLLQEGILQIFQGKTDLNQVLSVCGA